MTIHAGKTREMIDRAILAASELRWCLRCPDRSRTIGNDSNLAERSGALNCNHWFLSLTCPFWNNCKS